jgi:hypothetical protein
MNATISPTSQHWDYIEQPILDALAAGDGSDMQDEQLQAATRIERVAMLRALRSLKEDEYIAAVLVEVDQEDYPVRAAGIRLLPKGKRHTGLWRADWSTRLVEALETAIQNETDETECTKLRTVLAAVKSGVGTALNAVIAHLIDRGMSGMGQ